MICMGQNGGVGSLALATVSRTCSRSSWESACIEVWLMTQLEPAWKEQKKSQPEAPNQLFEQLQVGLYCTGHGTDLSSVQILIPTFGTRDNCHLLDSKKIT